MKILSSLFTVIALMLVMVACEQETIDLRVDESDYCERNPGLCYVDCPDGASAGTADFTKFVAVGNSLVSGYQAGALFTAGQENSLGKILASKFTCVGGSATFNQPDINSVNGFNALFSDPANGIVRGRLVLFDDGENVLPAPAGQPGLPAPFNTADLPGPYTGDKAALHNFAVPGIILGQALTPLTGGPAGNPAYNPYYARFASNPGTSTIMGDAIAAQGTFYLFWLGLNDVLGYASTGGDGSIPLTETAAFTTQYNGALGLLLGSLPAAKGVTANLPDVTAFPFFNSVLWNQVFFDPNDETDVGTVALLNNAFGGFNAALDGLVAFDLLAAEDAAARRVSYATGPNPVLINDEELEDLGPKFDLLLGSGAINQAQRDALALYEQARPMTADEKLTFTAALVLGELANPSNPTSINGVVVPLGDQFVLTETEIDLIQERTDEFNAVITTAVGNTNNRMALADVKSFYAGFLVAGADIRNGVTLTPGLAPPTGVFSEDGLHPNSRGYAYLANFIIDAINDEFGASIPHANVGRYAATGLPIE